MPIPKMLQTQIICHLEQKEALIEELHNLGVVEIVEIEEIVGTGDMPEGTFIEEPEITDLERKISELKYAIDFLYIYTKKPNLLESFFLPKYGVERKYYEEIVKNYDLSIIETIRDKDRHISELENEEKKLRSMIEQLLPWENLDTPLEDLETHETITEVGILSRGSLSTISSLEYASVQTVATTERRAWVLITCLKSFRKDMEAILRKIDFQEMPLPAEIRGTPRENIEKIQKDLEVIQKEREKTEKECVELTRERLNLMILHDYYQSVKAKQDVRRNFINTKKAFIVKGWIKEKDADLLKERLSFVKEVDISFSRPSETENVPVAIENVGLRPFEVVTKIYGLPLYREIDPTPLLTPFFIVFFALCLSDVIYGIVLISLSVYVLKKIKIGPDAQLLFRVLIIGGALSIVFGLLTSSWAGDLTAYLPGSLSLNRVRESLSLVDPLKSPIVMLEIALLLGLCQVWVGILIKGYLRIRDGYVLDAVIDQGLWLVLLPVGTLTVLNKMFGVQVPYADLLYKISLAALLGLVLTQGRYQKASNLPLTIGKKALVGVLSIYSIFGYLGDVLSYSRILALGLATSALAAAFNMVASQLGGISIVGPVIMAGVLVLTHLLNLIISTLGAFVHSGRLQFVEYFTKFLEGGGKIFKPFGFDPKYIKIMEEN